MAEDDQEQTSDQPTEPSGDDAQPSSDAEDAVEGAEDAAGQASDAIDNADEEELDDEAAEALAAAMSAINMSQQDSNDAIEQAMLDAMREDPGAPSVAEREAGAARPQTDLTGAAAMSLADLGASLAKGQNKETLDLLSDVQLNVRIELGRTRMFVEDILQLGNGAVVELDKLAGDPVDVFVNERHVARGEVLVLNDNFCIRVNEILDPGEED